MQSGQLGVSYMCNMHITLLLIAPCDFVESGDSKAKEKAGL